MENASEIKRHATEILKVFQNFCKRHGLRYFVTAGTLLGAVRHQGFIPWDDDIDIAMPRADYDQLREICAEDLPCGYTFQNHTTEENYPFFFSKIRKDGTFVNEACLEPVEMHKGVYIDIFPLDACPRNKVLGTLYFKWVEYLRMAVLKKANPDFAYGYRKRYVLLIQKILCRFSRERLFRLWDMTRKLVEQTANKRWCTIGGAHGYPRETYEKTWFSETVELPFEGLSVPAPAQWDALLTNMYGAYMTPPPVEERTGHFE